ncbi:hypothetical protein O9929_09635 [Vibrio lentus]|nr:hypothetical protein [Vibrio lentus]
MKINEVLIARSLLKDRSSRYSRYRPAQRRRGVDVPAKIDLYDLIDTIQMPLWLCLVM